MPRVVHVVVTDSFAGVERYVSEVARELAAAGWDVSVVGGSPSAMRDALGQGVRWLPGSNALAALGSLVRVGRQDVCHAHMTQAEVVALTARRAHQAPVVGTRHFARTRGTSRIGRLLSGWIARNLTRQIAISRFVAEHLERPPDSVVLNAVRESPPLWTPASRTVLIANRLEPEKETLVAIRAWAQSGLAERGWSLRLVGEGAERAMLEDWVHGHGVAAVEFGGWAANMAAELACAGILLAPAPGEPFGLTVLEAMAAGVPVVAAAGGGHLETIGLCGHAALFPPGDADAAAGALRALAGDEEARAVLSREVRDVAGGFTLDRHVESLLHEYAAAIGRPVGAVEVA